MSDEKILAEEKALDAVDLQRLALTTLAVLDLSTEKDLRIRRSKRGIYRVDVVYKELRQTTHSKTTLLEAMELALHRLRMITQPLRYAAERFQYARREERQA
jgi:CHAD domain-containing protein